MPARHRYKCLNPNCPSMTDKRKAMTFEAMQAPLPTCPHCASIRLEDWGPAINVMSGSSSNTQNTDRNLRAVADRYGLTDMNNRGGQAVKRPAAQNHSGPTVKVGGIDVPLSAATGAGCINVPSMAQKIPVANHSQQPARKNSPMMKQMTHVVGEHKASA